MMQQPAPAAIDNPADYTPAEWNLRVLDRRLADLRATDNAFLADAVARHLNRDDEGQVLRVLGHVCQLLVAEAIADL